MAIREGRWDCSSCGRVANLGRDVRCSGCGKPRGKVKFYLPPNEPAVLEAERLAEAKAGPDWVCAYCEASNRSTSAACTGCGAPRAEGTARVRGGGDATEKNAQEIEQEQQSARLKEEWAKRLEVQKRQQRRVMKVIGACLSLFFLMGCAGTFTAAFQGRWGGEKGIGGPSMRLGAPGAGAWVTVREKSATRSIAVEKQTMVQEQSWCRSTPSDARVLSRERRQNGTRCAVAPDAPWSPRGGGGGGGGKGPVLGLILLQEDMGNGYFEDSSGGSSGGDGGSWGGTGGSQSSCTTVAVYEDWCTWEQLRWIVVRTPSNTDEAAPPQWPVVRLAPGEREGPRTERYEAVVETSDGERVTMTTDGAHWMSWSPGQKRKAEFSFFGGLEQIGDVAH